MRESFEQVAEDLHEVRSIKMEQSVVDESWHQEQDQSIQELADRLTHVDIQVGIMAFEVRVQNEVESNQKFVDGKGSGTSLAK